MALKTPTAAAQLAAKRWTPEARVKAALRTLQEHGAHLTPDQRAELTEIARTPR